MKLTALITSLVLPCGFIYAQQSSPSASTDASSQQKESGAISEPSGTQPSNPSTGTTQTPNQSQQNIKQGEQSGIPTQEPAGAQRPDLSVTPSTGTNSSVTGAEVIGSKRTGTGSAGELKPGDPGYAAGAQRTQVTQLQNALAEFKTSSTVNTDQKTRLHETLTSMASSAKNLPPEFIARLSDDLTTSLTKVQISTDARSRLANDIAVILSAQPSAQADVQRAFTDVQTILLTGPNTTPLARATVCDLHLIASELVPDLHIEFVK